MPNNFNPNDILSALPNQATYDPFAIKSAIPDIGNKYESAWIQSFMNQAKPDQARVPQFFGNNPFTNVTRNSYFTNQGTPVFDPNTGMFAGLQNAEGAIGQPKSKISPAEKKAANQTRADIQNIPSLMNMYNAQIGPNERAQLKSSLETNPLYAQLAQRIAASNAMSEASTNKMLLEGPGGDTARSADKLARELDPEFYKTRGATADSLQQLLGSGLSGGEIEAIQRYLNQQNNLSGSLATPTQMSTVSNAMTFGEEARKRQERAIGLSNQFLPVSRTGIDTFQQATGRPGNTTGFQQGAGAQAAGLGGSASNLFGGLTQNALNNQTAMDINKMNQPNSTDRVFQAIGAIGSLLHR